jgi:hypothetical protein
MYVQDAVFGVSFLNIDSLSSTENMSESVNGGQVYKRYTNIM